MKKVEIYTKRFCPYCVLAKQLLDRKGVRYTEFEISLDRSLYTEMLQRSQRQTVPQIFIGDTHVGGRDELAILERSGQLDSLLGLEAA